MERLRTCSRLEEAKETRQLNATCNFELQPLTRKDMTSVWSQDEMGVRYQCSFPDLEGCIVVMSFFVGNTHSGIRDAEADQQSTQNRFRKKSSLYLL